MGQEWRIFELSIRAFLYRVENYYLIAIDSASELFEAAVVRSFRALRIFRVVAATVDIVENLVDDDAACVDWERESAEGIELESEVGEK